MNAIFLSDTQCRSVHAEIRRYSAASETVRRSPYIGWGKGRAWPLLTGERAHYELAAGSDIRHLIRAMEHFACAAGLLPEQIWDAPDYAEKHMFLGGPTTAVQPLMWAHADYIKLLRSVHDKQVFDFIPEVARRYQDGSFRGDLEIWKPNRQVSQISRGMVLRIQTPGGFKLRWSQDGWRTITESNSIATDVGVSFLIFLLLRRKLARSSSHFCGDSA